jgi:site-specific recombinase XerD
MSNDQLALFGTGGRKRGVLHQQLKPATAPTGESTVMQTLPAYQAHLSSKYANKTVKMYVGDVRELSLYLIGRKVQDITLGDLQEWRSELLSGQGASVGEKTLARKASAIINYFSWLVTTSAILTDPSGSLVNSRVESPLPDYLFQSELEELLQIASADPRTYLMVLLYLETGMKSSELLRLTPADVDTSDPYQPELWIRHKGMATRRDRKVALPAMFVGVYEAYRAKYGVQERLFAFTARFGEMLFNQLRSELGTQKELTSKTLRHTHVVRAYRRGEDPDLVFERIGLASSSRKDADEMYTKLAARGM